MLSGRVDVAVSHEVDTRGIHHWSIHLYEELLGYSTLLPMNGDAPLQVPPLRTVYECVGNRYNFRVTVNGNYNPFQEPRPDESICVADRLVDVDMRNADEALRAVPVDNTAWEYSSQVWVFDALDALYDIQLIPDTHFADTHISLCELRQEAGDMPGDMSFLYN